MAEAFKTDARTVFAGFVRAHESGLTPHIAEYVAKHPEHAEALRNLYQDWTALRRPGIVLAAGPGAPIRIEGNVSLEATPVSHEALLAQLDDIGRRNPDTDRYVLKDTLGEGGMGTVVRASDRVLQRDVALKVIRKGPAGQAVGPLRLTRFVREAQILAGLSHPGIVAVLDFGIDARGDIYLTMPIIEGRDLREVLDAVATGDLGWTVTRVVGVLLRVCEALSYAHERGIMHRDITPRNIRVGRFGETYVMDWGLSKLLAMPEEDEPRGEPAPAARERSLDRQLTLTEEGVALGTPAYMSPEQAEGRRDIGPPSDIYSVGALLYHLIHGHAPFLVPGARLGALEIVRRLREHGPPEFGKTGQKMPAELTSICRRAMARRPGDRYLNMASFADDLRAYLEGRVVRAHATGAGAALRKWVKRNKALAAAIFLGITTAVIWLSSLDVSKRARALAEAEATRDLASRLTTLSDGSVITSQYTPTDYATVLRDYLDAFADAGVATSELGAAATLRDRLARLGDPAVARSIDDGVHEAALRFVRGGFAYSDSMLTDARPEWISPDDAAHWQAERSAARELVAEWPKFVEFVRQCEQDQWSVRCFNAFVAYSLARVNFELDELIAQAQAPERSAAELVRLVWVATNAGKSPEELRWMLERAIELDPGDFSAHYSLAKLGDHAFDVHQLDIAVALRPQSVAARYNLALAYEALGPDNADNGTRAAQNLREALRLYPDLREACAMFGSPALARRVPYPEAIAMLEVGHARWPDDSFIAGQLAFRYDPSISSLDAWKAAQACQEALRLSPHDARLYVTLGRALARFDYPDGEIAALRRGVEAAPESAMAVSELCVELQERLPDSGDAGRLSDEHLEQLALAEQAFRLEPDTPASAFNLACAYYCVGDVSCGWWYHELAVERGSEAAVEALETVRRQLAARVDSMDITRDIETLQHAMKERPSAQHP